MTKSLLLITLLALLVFPACGFTFNLANSNRVNGSGNAVSETRDVSGFNEVSLEVPSTLYITQGDTESLTIEADDNVLELIETEVNGSRLTLGIKPTISLNLGSRIKFYLTVKDLNAIRINGSGRVEAETLTTTDLILGISGSGAYVIIQLTAARLETNIDGSGKIIVAGTAPELDVHISGSGNFNCPDLAAQNAVVKIDGSGSVTLWPTDTLDIRISGSGTVRYYGSPTITQSISGSGSIKPQGDK